MLYTSARAKPLHKPLGSGWPLRRRRRRLCAQHHNRAGVTQNLVAQCSCSLAFMPAPPHHPLLMPARFRAPESDSVNGKAASLAHATLNAHHLMRLREAKVSGLGTFSEKSSVP